MAKSELDSRIAVDERAAAPRAAGEDGRAAAPRRTAQRLHIAIFLIVLALPGLGMLLPFPFARPLVDSREEVPEFPRLHADYVSVFSFPGGLYGYLNAHYGFRALLLREHAWLKLNWLRTSPSKQVALGKHGWIFYTGDREVECWRRTAPFSESDLDRWQHVLEARQNWLAQRGIRFLFVVCPDKHTIYPEYMPYSSQPPPQPSRLDQLAERLRHSPQVEFLDLRPALFASKPRYVLYRRIDSHWTETGAFLASQQVIAKLRTWFPQVTMPRLDAFTPASAPVALSDLVRLLGLPEGDLLEDTVCLLPKRPFAAKLIRGDPKLLPTGRALDSPSVTERKGAPVAKAVILRDSFAVALLPYLSEEFGQTIYLWTKNLDRDFIEQEKPDVVIMEVVERDLMDPIPAWALGT